MYKKIVDIKQYKFEWMHLSLLLIFLYPLFTNTLRHWASSMYVLLALAALLSIKKFTYDLRKEEKIFLIIMILHVLSTAISNTLSDWTYASKTWFFSGDVRFLFAVPIYLYLRKIPEIWKYFLAAVPFAAIIIGMTGIIDFMSRYFRGDIGQIFAEGVYGHIFQGNISVLWSVLSYATAEYFRTNKKMQALCLAGAILAAIGALVSVTRNAWLSLLLLYIVIFIMQGGSVRLLKGMGMGKIIVIALTLFSVMYFMSGLDYVKLRLAQVYEEPITYFNADRSKPIEYGSLTIRLELWRGAIYAFQEKPVFGHGMGNSGMVHNAYIRDGRLNELIYQESVEKHGSPSHVHSTYLEYLASTGMVGFVLIMLLIFYAPYVAYQFRRDGGLAWKFVMLHSAAFAVASLTEVPFVRNNWTSVFLVTGMVFFVWLIRENDLFLKRTKNE